MVNDKACKQTVLLIQTHGLFSVFFQTWIAYCEDCYCSLDGQYSPSPAVSVIIGKISAGTFICGLEMPLTKAVGKTWVWFACHYSR